MSVEGVPGAPAEGDRAWAGLSTNMFVLPGLGSLLLRRRSGWLQATLALTGLGLTVAWLVEFLTACIRQRTLPQWPLPRLGLALTGIGLFALAWTWALATALPVFRRTRARAEHTRPKAPGC